MTDPLEEALAASTRAVQALDQQLAAARDANARLTAELVKTQLDARRHKADADHLEQLVRTLEHAGQVTEKCYGSALRRIDELEAALSHAKAQHNFDVDRYEAELTKRAAGGDR